MVFSINKQVLGQFLRHWSLTEIAPSRFLKSFKTLATGLANKKVLAERTIRLYFVQLLLESGKRRQQGGGGWSSNNKSRVRRTRRRKTATYKFFWEMENLISSVTAAELQRNLFSSYFAHFSLFWKIKNFLLTAKLCGKPSVLGGSIGPG